MEDEKQKVVFEREKIEEEIENGNRKCRKISVVVKYRFSYKYVQLLAAVFHGWVEFGLVFWLLMRDQRRIFMKDSCSSFSSIQYQRWCELTGIRNVGNLSCRHNFSN